MATTSDKSNNSDEILITDYTIGCHEEINLYVLRMTEAGNNRSLTLKINELDAQILGLKLPGQSPLSLNFYVIISSILEAQNATIKKVVIHNRKEGRFVAQLHLVDASGKIIVTEFAADHTATFAIIMKAPIYVKSKIFDLVSEDDEYTIQWYDIDEDYTMRLLSRIPCENMVTAPVKELETYLDIAVKKENYELAKKIYTVIQQIIKP
jgi:bifunctional DNase/RNase